MFFFDLRKVNVLSMPSDIWHSQDTEPFVLSIHRKTLTTLMTAFFRVREGFRRFLAPGPLKYMMDRIIKDELERI